MKKSAPHSNRAGAGAPDARHGRHVDPRLMLSALGIVYGDIGTSPLYAIRECFHGEHGIALNESNLLGVLSLVFWSLTIVISLKYLVYVMRADNGGEGGVLALMALAAKTTKGRRALHFPVIMLGLFGAALLYGDGMITPAISVLGATEGLAIAAPTFEHFIVPLTIAILIGLFAVQKRGTAQVGSVFGPITLVWFIVLAGLGINQIARHPHVLVALSPTHAVAFLVGNHTDSFLVLGAVFLVVTGGEALYADMGHFGARPIRATWFAIVFPALLLNYFGQGALLLAQPDAIANPFYMMAPSSAVVPLTVLATCATVIASQAVLSGAFSLTRQAMMLGYWPRMEVRHTSPDEIGQIYVPAINWLLMICTIALVLGFGSSSRLAAAYGIAVTTTMVITTALAYIVARYRWNWSVTASVALTLTLFAVDFAFLGANAIKIEDGGWFPLVIASVVFLVMTTWRKGREILAAEVKKSVVPIEDFFEIMRVEPTTRVPGTAVFMAGNPSGTPPALMKNFIHNHAVHERVVLLTVVTENVAYVDTEERVETTELGQGFIRVIAHYGFMESPDVVALLARDDTPTPAIEYTTFFLGHEAVLAEKRGKMSMWRARLFSFLTRNATRPVAFFNIPPERVMEIGSHIPI